MARSIAAVSGSSGRNRGVLLLAAVFGILSAVLIFAFLKTGTGDSNNVNDVINSGVGAESVVVLTRDVLAGEEITPDMLTTATLPAVALLPGHSADVEQFVGRVAVQTMFAGEQAITAKVTAFEGEATLAWQVPEGLRGLGLTVPHESWIIGGLPQPGDRVDIIAITAFRVTDPLTGSEKPELVSGIIAQDIKVLALGQSLVKGVPAVEGAAAGQLSVDGETREGSISVTLALTPEQSAKVALIDAMDDNEGQWRIIARRTGDTDPLAGATTWGLDDIFDFTN